MTLEKLEEIRDKIAALHIDTASDDEENAYEKVIRIIDAAIAEERAESAKPEPGDVVEPFNEWWGNGHSYLSERDAREIYSEFSGLMRAADVRREIEEAK